MYERANKIVDALNFILGVNFQPEIRIEDIAMKDDLGFPPRGVFWRPRTIVINKDVNKIDRTLIHEFCHMYSYHAGNKSMKQYTLEEKWYHRAEEQLACQMTKVLFPLVKKYLQNGDKRKIKRRWKQLATSLKGTFTRLSSNQASRGAF